jgi:hypothetical protein
MKTFFIFLFIINFSQVFAQQTIINDKNAEERTITTFTGIKVSGGIDVYLSEGDNYSLAVSASEDKYRDNIKTEVNNGVLVISYNNDHSIWNSGNKKLRVYISFKLLQRIEGNGACEFIINGMLNENALLVKLSGACNIKGLVKITNLTLELSGASTVKINGTAQNLILTANGASDVKNYDLRAENCVAKLSGASDVRITVSNSISASASGTSTLYYQGNPDKKTMVTSGASTISQRK